MVYMHKTTRAAEKMLESLLSVASSQLRDAELARWQPILRYFVSENPSLGLYLDLDDSAVWSALTAFSELSVPYQRTSELAKRLRDRVLYKCVDIGDRDTPGGNLYLRFKRELERREISWRDDLLFDEPTLAPYKWYDFDDASALNKVLVKSHEDMDEPVDIIGESDVVKTLRETRIQRVYAPDSEQAEQLRDLLVEV